MTHVFQILVLCLSLLLLALTFISFVKIPHGLLRGPAFFRLQTFAIAVLLLPFAIALATGAPTGPFAWITLISLLTVIAVNAGIVAKFTPLWRKQSAPADPALMADTARHLTVLCANIKMSNRHYDQLIALARTEQPDILAVIETDQRWVDALAPLKPDYAHHIEHPLETGYGLVVYSRLPLRDVTVEDKVTDGVPSIRATATLRSGDDIALYIIHPEPPTATDQSTGRDSEIALAGMDAAKNPLPAIVAGDLNDVAWSVTTRRFQRLSGLLDPRIGRGFYNTFNAFYPLFRWPLDHLFHDPKFRFVSMRRLPHIQSDHFPVSFTVALAATSQGRTKDPKTGERAHAANLISDEKQTTRDPIGTDWEDDS